MDTVTHALSGALLARATSHPQSRLKLRDRTLAGALAAAFPDLDYALFLVDPLNFLNWHRGPTHSLLLLPLWAWLLAFVMARLTGRQRRDFYGVCALGLGIHIAGDFITIYGTQILSPLSTTLWALGLVFDIDPYLAIMVAAGFWASLRRPPLMAALVALTLITGYLGLQMYMQRQTISLGERYSTRHQLVQSQLYAFPRPFSPFMWQIVVSHGDRYWVAHVNHLTRLTAVVSPKTEFPWSVLAAYRPPDDLFWKRYYHFGKTEATIALAEEVWQQNRLRPFRRFAALPALYRSEYTSGGESCVWFTDLRHLFPAMPPPFRYGMCRTGPRAVWRLYRLRYFSTTERQPLY